MNFVSTRISDSMFSTSIRLLLLYLATVSKRIHGSTQKSVFLKVVVLHNLVWVCGLYCKLWTDFTRCSGVSVIDFEQVNAGWIHVEYSDLYSFNYCLVSYCYSFIAIDCYQCSLLVALIKVNIGALLYYVVSSRHQDFPWVTAV